MISAYDVLYKHTPYSRYLYRADEERVLCYQLAGNDPVIIAKAALHLETLGADLLDLNCGCPKTKIRKKGAGSALLENPLQLCNIVKKSKRSDFHPINCKTTH